MMSAQSGAVASDLGAGARRRYVILDRIDSTNAEALRRAALGERGPLWLRANVQTNGRGRSGRTWHSVSGSFAASLLFTPTCDDEVLNQLSLVAGLSVHDALGNVAAGPEIADALRLKWPNDILFGPAKAGGILVECSRFSGDMVAVIGIGLNTSGAPPVADVEVADLSRTLKPECSLSLMLETIADRMDQWLTIWQHGAGFDAIRSAWLSRALPVGTEMTVHTNDQQMVRGLFAGLDRDGALLLRESPHRVARFIFGDVTLTD